MYGSRNRRDSSFSATPLTMSSAFAAARITTGSAAQSASRYATYALLHATARRRYVASPNRSRDSSAMATQPSSNRVFATRSKFAEEGEHPPQVFRGFFGQTGFTRSLVERLLQGGRRAARHGKEPLPVSCGALLACFFEANDSRHRHCAVPWSRRPLAVVRGRSSSLAVVPPIRVG